MQKAINNYEKSVQSRNLANSKLNSAQANYSSAVNQKNSLNVNNFKVGIYDGDVVTYIRVCNGHSRSSTEFWVEDAEYKVRNWYNIFAREGGGSKFKSCEAWRNTGKTGWFLWAKEEYTITAKWAHIDDWSWCDDYYVRRDVSYGNTTYKVTAESHKQYNAAIIKAQKNIDDYQNQMNQASKELNKAEQDIANCEREINGQVQNVRNNLQDLLNQQEGLTNNKTNLQNQITNQNLANQRLVDQIKVQQDLIVDLEKALMNKMVEKTKSEYKEVLLLNEISAKEKINEDLLKIIKLLESRIHCTSEQNIELERLVKNQDQIYKNLCKSAIKANQDLLDKVRGLTPEGRAYLLMDSLIKNDVRKEMIEHYTSSMGIDVNYLAMIAFDSNNMEIFKYALKNGANPINYSRDNITLLQKMIQADKSEYVDLAMADKSTNDLGSTILSAIKSNDLSTINKLLANNSNLFSDRILTINIMQIIIYEKNEALLDQVLLTNPEFVNLVDSFGNNLLHTTLKHGTENMVVRILNSKFIDIQDQVEILIINNETELLTNLINICSENQIELLNDDIRAKLHDHNIDLDELEINIYNHINYDFNQIDYKTEIDLLY